MSVQSFSGKRYLLTFIDDLSRKVFVYFLRTKDEVYDHFVNFKAFAENQTDKKVKILRSYNGGENISNAVDKFLKQNGIFVQKSQIATAKRCC